MEADRLSEYVNDPSVERHDLVLEREAPRLLCRLLIVFNHSARHMTRHEPPIRIVRTIGESFVNDVKACCSARRGKLRRRWREEHQASVECRNRTHHRSCK